jgi:hypothetical protein
VGDAYGATLKYSGGGSVPLTAIKQTTPSLVILMNGTKHYGAMISGTAPSDAIKINKDGTTYWIGSYCAPGKYSATGTSACQDCGIGYYCEGGNYSRAACTYGSVSCNGINHAFDPPLPGEAPPMNKELTLAQVNQWIPATSFSQWKKISGCSNFQEPGYSAGPVTGFQNSAYGCATGTIGPGTYLFITRTSFCNSGGSDIFSGISRDTTAVRIIIFDHAVSYKIIHVNNSFYPWIDLDHDIFTSHSFAVPSAGYCSNNNYTNISGLPGDTTVPNMYIYELK